MAALDDLPLALTVHQVAEQLQVTPWTVYERMRRGEIPFVRLGGRARRIPRQWLEKLLDGAVELTSARDGGA